MRILQLINGLGAGGAERQLLRLSTALRAAGHSVALACLKRADGLVGRQLREAGWPVADLRGANPLDPRPVLRLRRLLRSGRFDVLHSHLARADLVAGLARRKLAITHVSTRHSDFEPWADRRLWWRAYQRELVRIDRVVAVSEAVAGALRNWGVRDDRIRVIPGIVAESALAALPAPGGPIQRIGFLGRMDRVKGIDLFLETAARLTACHPELEFLVAGDGPERRTAQNWALRRGLPVRFIGWITDLPAFFGQIDLLLVPSRHEGLGLSAAEALCAGRPVVGTAVGGLAGLLGDQAVQPDTASLVSGVERVLRDGAARPRSLPGDPAAWVASHEAAYDLSRAGRADAPLL